MEMYQIKETVEKVMGGRHRWGHIYSRFQGIFFPRAAGRMGVVNSHEKRREKNMRVKRKPRISSQQRGWHSR